MQQIQAMVSGLVGKCSIKMWLCLIIMALVPGWAAAINVSDLYVATVRVADRSETARNLAVANALGVVLARLSGQQEKATRLATTQTNAARLVQRVGYVAGGQLEVGFDSTAINALLEQAGLPLWDRIRPATLIVLPAALQAMTEVRATVEQAAKDRGLPLVWSTAESSEQFSINSLAQLQTLARQYQVETVLLARATTAEPLAANLRWQLVFRGASQEVSGGVEEGLNFAADQISRYYAVAGRQTSRQIVEVAGVDTVEAYAGALNYLNSMLVVRAVSMQSLQGDVVRLQVDLRGNQETLRRVLSVEQVLIAQPSSTAEASATLSYRYNH